MRFVRILGLASVAALSWMLTACNSCTRQFDQTENNARLKKEWENSVAPTPKLTENGELPAAAGADGAAAAAKDPAALAEEKFATFCSTCHGTAGDGNGPAGAALNPHPRNFTDAAWQEKTDDARIAQVTKNGGASVGLSPMMAPWGGSLSDAEITALVAKIRRFKK
jgi:cytochrome c553